MMRPNGWHQRDGKRGRQRGGIYILTLATSLLITSIGIAAITHGRLLTQRTTGQGQAAEARRLAIGGLEAGLVQLNQGHVLLSNQTNDVWARQITTAQAKVDLRWTDPVDGKLIDDDQEPMILSALTTMTNANQAIGVEVFTLPSASLTGVLTADGGFEAGTSTWQPWPGGSDALLNTSTASGAAQGASYLLVSSRTSPRAGINAALDVSAWPEQAEVEVSFWSRQSSGGSDQVIASLALETGGSVNLPVITQTFNPSTPASWTQHTCRIKAPWPGAVSKATLRIHTADNNHDLELDGITVNLIQTSPVRYARPLTLHRVLLSGS